MLSIETLENQRRLRSNKYGDNASPPNPTSFQNAAKNHILNFNQPSLQSPRVDQPSPRNISPHYESQTLESIPKFDDFNKNINIGDPSSKTSSGDLSYLQSQIQSLHHLIERLISVDIPARLKPNEEAISNLYSKFESSQSSNHDSIQSLKDRISELSLNFNTTTQKAADHSEKIEASLNKVKSDVSTGNEMISNAMNQFDSKISQIESSIKILSNKQQQLEQFIRDQVSQLSNSISEVQRTSNQRDQILSSQVESLNQQTIETFSNVNESIEKVSSSFNESISSLANDARESFNIIRTEHEEDIENLNMQLEKATTQINESFETLQKEVVSTFMTIQGTMKENNTKFQESLTKEVQNREFHDQRIVELQNNLATSFTLKNNEMKSHIDKIDQSVNEKIEKSCIYFFNQWKSELAVFVNETTKIARDQKVRIDNNEIRLAELNNEIQDKNQKSLLYVNEQISQNNQVISDKFTSQEKANETALKTLRLSLKEFSVMINNTSLIIPRIEKMEHSIQKQKQKLKLALDQNEDLLALTPQFIDKNRPFGENYRPTERIEMLERVVGKRRIPPRLNRLEREILKIRKLIPNELIKRIDRIENGFTGASLVSERVARLEDLHNLQNIKNAYNVQKSILNTNSEDLNNRMNVRLDNEINIRLRRSNSCGLIKLNTVLPRTPIFVENDEMLSSETFNSQEEEEESEDNRNRSDYYSYGYSSLTESRNNKRNHIKPRYEDVPNSRLQLTFDIHHEDVKSENPKPGLFILLIGEPRKSSRNGIHRVKPRRYDEYIYPNPESNPEDVQALLLKRKEAKYQPVLPNSPKTETKPPRRNAHHPKKGH
ncbi:hypothetical protein TRFO_27744 [Tritrichomonas foetus]|uniref:Uncharacterized protein n=1 Tax=Tritrichomonas foetus TaxID=1144522 RepID=A0A1J4K4R0_9EUKA|nr:hypothetical protein TRFO_27744 [Tritrichomonas foetus]|eukprot:OHT04670.1 hypothetical protein TRFO_27744 [Tritrichomonas foetus]